MGSKPGTVSAITPSFESPNRDIYPDHRSEIVSTSCKYYSGHRDQDVCLDHQSELVTLCKDCDGQSVCVKCVASTHRGHTFDNVVIIASKKKQKIKDYVQMSEKTVLPNIRHQVELANDQIKGNSEYFKQLSERIKSRGEKLKAEIDSIVNEFINTTEEVKRRNYDYLSQHKQELQELYSMLTQRVVKCKETVDSGDQIKVIEFEDIDTELKQPTSPKLQTADFIEGKIRSLQLRDGLGNLSIKRYQRETTSQEGELLNSEGNTTASSRKLTEYRSNDSTVISKFQYATTITTVAKSTPDSTWVSYCGDRKISLVDLQGKVKGKIKMGSNVKYISVSPITGNLWLCCNNFAVYEVLDKAPTKRFTTNYRPWSLCVTSNSFVAVVTEDHHVTVYRTTGKEAYSTRRLEERVVVFPRNITVCPTTGDIAVCDRDLSGLGGKDKPHVAVFDSSLFLKYRYRGPPESEDGDLIKVSFHPLDVAYDTQRHLLVADCSSKCIQLVSGEGQYLATIYTDVLHPRNLTIMDNGLLCVGFDDNVKVIQYRI